MRTKKEILQKIEKLQYWLDTVEKQHLLTEENRITFAGNSGGILMLKWVLGEDIEGTKDNET